MSDVELEVVDPFRRPDMCISEFLHHVGNTLAEVRLGDRVDGVPATTERSMT
jgi:hypothetical protein